VGAAATGENYKYLPLNNDIALAIACSVQLGRRVAQFSPTRDEQFQEQDMRIANQCSFQSHDGRQLFYRYWPPLHGPGRQAILLLHRGHEHSGRLQHVVDELQLPGMAMFACDARGHGLSRRVDETAARVATFARDLQSFVQHISSAHEIPAQDIAIIAQSVGSVVAAAWVHDYAPPIRCMVLAAPAFQVKLYVPLARTVLTALQRILGEFRVNSYVKPRALTHDAERIASYQADPLITRAISARLLLDLYRTSDRMVKDAQAIRVPTQLLISGSDWVVRKKPQHRFFQRLGSEVKEEHVFAGWFHDTLGEKERRLAISKARKFIVRAFAQTPQRSSLLSADAHGHTRNEFEELRRPLPRFSPKRLRFALARAGLNTIGRLAGGIRLGIETGFDSGATLDYVYENRPSGITALGKSVDRFFLNAVGWQGIRERRHNIEQALQQCVARLRDERQPLRILDIAAGHGRYVLHALKGTVNAPDRILLRDFSERAVREGQALIHQEGMDGIARFERGDAFDFESLRNIRPAPNMTVVSGLYELFPENHLLQTSLAGLARAMREGGYLIYTGQPWHPQLEFIARTLPNRDHQPWIMRRRTQEELDQLIQAAGFVKLDQTIDDWGIFTVSIAQKRSAWNQDGLAMPQQERRMSACSVRT
jgi:alpha-beta hydrolase superfamily lysophospholipase